MKNETKLEGALNRLGENAASIADLKERINTADQKLIAAVTITEDSSLADKVAALETKYQDTLAAHSLKQVTAAEVADAAAMLADARKEIKEQNEKRATSADEVAGLKRLIDQLKADLQAAEVKGRELAAEYIVEQAEIDGMELDRAIRTVRRLTPKILGCLRIAERLTYIKFLPDGTRSPGSPYAVSDVQPLILPSFRMLSSMAKTPDSVLDVEYTSAVEADTIRQELGRQGVTV